MDKNEAARTRRKQLAVWFETHAIPESEKSFISQLINGKASFGEKAARRLERDYEMGEGYLDACSLRRCIPTTRNQTRLQNTRKLIEKCGGAASFADKLGMSASQVSQFAGRKPIRNIGNNLAEKIEAAFGRQTGWLDGFQAKNGAEMLEIYDSFDDQFEEIHAIYNSLDDALRTVALEQMRALLKLNK